MINELHRYYFTFGESECYPFKGGWIEICAPNITTAQAVFKALYPCTPDRDCLNCADIYTAEQFAKTKIREEGNLGARCHREIIIKIRDGRGAAQK